MLFEEAVKLLTSESIIFTTVDQKALYQIHYIQRFCSIPSDITKFNVLYNSELRFHERLYASLDVDLCRVRLHEPLEVIVQNPLLYVRDLVPKPCFDALANLDQVRSLFVFWIKTPGLFPIIYRHQSKS